MTNKPTNFMQQKLLEKLKYSFSQSRNSPPCMETEGSLLLLLLLLLLLYVDRG